MTCLSCGAPTLASTRCSCGAVALLPDELEVAAAPLTAELPLDRRGDREAGLLSFAPIELEVDLDRRFTPRGDALPPLSYEVPEVQGPALIEIDLDAEIAAVDEEGEPVPAPPLGRLFASHAIDLAVVVAVPLVPVGAAAHALSLSAAELLRALAAFGPASFAALALTALTASVYLTASLLLGGRTLGDRALGLRAVALRSGAQPTPGQAALAALTAPWFSLPSLVHAVLDPHHRGLHERLAGLVRLNVR